MDIREMLMQSDAVVEKATLVLYNRQTEEERGCQNTLEQNGVGYNGVDAPIMSSFAQQIKLKGRNLSAAQIRVARKILPKYSRQLNAHIDELAEAMKHEAERELAELNRAGQVPVQKPEQNHFEAIRNAKTQAEPVRNPLDSLKKRCRFEDGKIWVRLEYSEVGMRTVVKNAGFKWDTNRKMWYQQDDGVARALLDLPFPSREQTFIDLEMFPELFPFQKEDVNSMLTMGNCLNANEMGLGKTLESLIMLDGRAPRHTLIACTSTLKQNWYLEFLKWQVADENEVLVISGTPKQKEKQLEHIHTARFVIINYDQIVIDYVKEGSRKKWLMDSNPMLNLLRTVKWDCIVADEIHKLKNAKASRTVAMESIKGGIRTGLTGTPIQNRPHDLFSILHWIDPFYSSESFWRFAEAFCEIESNGFGATPKGLTKDPARLAALDRLLSHVMIRREKATVMNQLPAKTYQKMVLTMPTVQRKLYKQIETDIEYEMGNGEVKNVANMLSRLMKLQQLTSNPELFELNCGNQKFEAIVDLLENGSKVVVFSRFEKTISALAARLDKEGIRYAKITGATKDRQAEIDQFQNDSDCQVFLGTIKAAGEGITLTASSTVVFLDREWSPAQNLQAEDRVHRIGQINAVLIIDLLYANTIDQWVEQVLDRKLEDIATAIKENKVA